MYRVNGTRITLTRGDSAFLGIDLYKEVDKNREPYLIQEGDVIRFALKENTKDETCLVRKILVPDSESSVILEIEPQDTKPLPFLTTYKYDVELTTVLGKVHTFMKGELYLDEEVD